MNEHPMNQTSYSPEIKRNKGISPLWILPILTVFLAGWLVTKAIHDSGERIQIYFSNAQGLVAGRTTIRYQGLEVGMIREIKLAPELDRIYVEADIYPEATRLLSDSTRFWLVKPTASLSGVSGLDALVSGNYIAIHPGNDGDEQTEHSQVFHALDNAPSDLISNGGLLIALKASDLGGLSIGSQIVYKKIPIGEVFSYQLDENAQSVLIQASIKEEYRHLITSKSRFWNVSGVGTSLGFDGIDVRLESLSAMIGGAIAVDSPDGGEPVAQHSQFRLYKDLKTAGRGIPITIKLPDDNGISPSGTSIMYRGIEIGQVTHLQLNDDHSQIIAHAAIQPSFSSMLTNGSQFILQEAKVSLSGIENLPNLVKGNYLTLIPGNGERTRQFTALRKRDYQQSQSHSIELTLFSENAYGLNAGAPLLFRGVNVGVVKEIALNENYVTFQLAVEQKYEQLIRSQNRFYVTGAARAELNASAINVTLSPVKQLMTGSISFISEGSQKIQPHYSLYANQSLAELAKYQQSGSQTIYLNAKTQPPVQAGSPLLYRNLKVGKVERFALKTHGVEIAINIDNQYRHLINENTVFWNQSGVEINASLAGIHVQAAPLQSLLQGGIAFDSLPGIENKNGQFWKLYDSYQHAQKFGEAITLIAQTNLGVIQGTPIKYQGVQVGEVMAVSPSFTDQQVTFSARIQPEYAAFITRANSVFWVAETKVGLNGVTNLDNLFSKNIEVKPGEGDITHTFTLANRPYQPEGIQFTLQSEEKGSVSIDTPVLYRGMEVGRVIDVQLGAFADRVISIIEIAPEYAYLVRKNTVFWNTSGVDVSIGLSGANIKSGTFDSLVRGGITFSTPEQKQLLEPAPSGHAFYLHPTAQDDWKQWKTAIPQP
ncbi:PqiB family protein [Vibrio cincinnatiensis]|uniref:PqiB family protein n=1 Tax=Vibrio cincinnatiensis TaxID=675 RepID=UPI001EE048A7|nr:MlaD family protein [Vibrio cincinnatiensis]MCG3729019.1 MCE family protein [Vibrio cincinnatiensis]